MPRPAAAAAARRTLLRVMAVLPAVTLANMVAAAAPVHGEPGGRVARDRDAWTIPFAACPPVLDGRLNEACWRSAPVAEEFRQAGPVPGAAPSERTRLRLVADEHHLYVGFECFDQRPGQIRAHRMRRDQAFRDDWVAVLLSLNDADPGAIELFVNPVGCQMDAYQTGERDDLSLDYDFLSAAHQGPQGWSAELAIPWHILGEGLRTGAELRLLALRHLSRSGEQVAFPVHDLRSPGWHRRGMPLRWEPVGIHGRRELLPSIASRTQIVRRAGAPREVRSTQVGATARWALSNGLRLAGTVRPDFSQVEADIPQLEGNRRYPVYYPEKRPFFLSEREFFTLAATGDALLRGIHTRTIASPLWAVSLARNLGARQRVGLLCAYERAADRREWGLTDLDSGEGRFTGLLRARATLSRHGQAGLLLGSVRHGAQRHDLAGLDAGARFGAAQASGHLLWSRQTRTGADQEQSTEGHPNRGAAAAARLWWANSSWRAETWSSLVSPGFTLPAGLLRDPDCRRAGWELERRFHRGSVWFPVTAVAVRQQYREPYAGGASECWSHMRAQTRVSNGQSLWVGLARDREQYGGRRFRLARVWFGGETRPHSTLTLSGESTIGQALYYDPGRPLRGRVKRVTADLLWEPSAAWACRLVYLTERFSASSPTGAGSGAGYLDSVVSARPHWYPHPATGVRILLDWRPNVEGLLAEALVTLRTAPGGEIQLGYGGSHLGEGHPSRWRAVERSFYLRYTHRVLL